MKEQGAPPAAEMQWPPAPRVPASLGAPEEEIAYGAEFEADEAEVPSGTTGRNIRVALLALLGVAGLAWIALNVAISAQLGDEAALTTVRDTLTTVAPILVLIVGLVVLVQVLGLHARSREQVSQLSARGINQLIDQADQAATRLGTVHGQLQDQASAYASATQATAGQLLEAVDALAIQQSRIITGADSMVAVVARLEGELAALRETAKPLESNLTRLTGEITASTDQLGARQDSLEGQMRLIAEVARGARTQMDEAGLALGTRLDELQKDMKSASEALSHVCELSSARVDLTLERVKTVSAAAEGEIEARAADIEDLVERARRAMTGTAESTVDQAGALVGELETRLGALDRQLDAQAEKSNIWLKSVAQAVGALSEQFDRLEASAISRTEKLATTLQKLSDAQQALNVAMDRGGSDANGLIERAERLLLALDAGIRELDESLPAAALRAEARLDHLSAAIQGMTPGIASIELATASVVKQLQNAGAVTEGHAASLDEALQRSNSALNGQEMQIKALASAVDEAGKAMVRLGAESGPEMIALLQRVDAMASGAAQRARDAIGQTVAHLAADLGKASSDAVQRAVETAVVSQVERVVQVADDAIKTAHRATDKLTRQMLDLTDSSVALDNQIESRAETLRAQDRELISQRSQELIDALNSRAIDVSKWLDRDVTEPEWAAYLKGDKSLFARRAARLVSNVESKTILALADESPEFSEHLYRYIQDFEHLLKTILATRDGSSLAMVMLSSDLGKLYVGLAQATERLRT